jgi:hypothetical protein
MSRDDERLLAALADAVRAARAVPSDFVEAGKAAYSWRTIDAELATLTYDSAAELTTPGRGLVQPGTRAEPAVLRALTFASPRLEIELQIGADSLLGQVVPPTAGRVEVQLASDTVAVAAVAIDQVGWFEVRPAPTGPFRLRVSTADEPDVLTGWVTL